jgi:hypothetical protein
MTDPLGTWSAPETTPGDSRVAGDNAGVVAVHAVLLHTGSLLIWSGQIEDQGYRPEAWVWNPLLPVATADRVPFPDGVDLFGSHHAALPDGRTLIVGGALPFDTPGAQRGANAICVFTPMTNTLERIGQMFEGRMYPTLVGLADGTYAVFSGFTAAPTTPGTVADSVELFRPPFFRSRQALYRGARLPGAARALPTYPGLLLAPGGAVFHLGTTWQYAGLDPRGGDVNTPVQTCALAIDAQQNGATWNDLLPDRLQPHREEGTFILLPPAQAGRILVAGGGHIQKYDTDPNADYHHVAGADPRAAEILDTQNPSGGWTPAGENGQMHLPRVNPTAVILPDGKVLIVGGTSNFKWQKAPGSVPSNACELYDPATNRFEVVAELRESRTSRATALLLLDGRVWVGGGVDPDGAELHRRTMSFYEPPYVALPRPVIAALTEVGTDLPVPAVYGGQEFVIRTPQAATIQRAALIRPGSATHHTDTQQRYVDLPVTARQDDRIQVATPADPSVSPPGYYMVWIVDEHGAPCREAFWLRLLPAIANYTVGTFQYNNKSYNVHVHNAVPALAIEGEHFHGFQYDEDAMAWQIEHGVVTLFATLNKLAEYLIDNGMPEDHVHS